MPARNQETPGFEPLVIRSRSVTVSCVPQHGFVITSLRDVETGAEAFWTRPGHRPAACSRAIGPAGDASGETFLDLFVGGWFEMFPAAGWAGEIEGHATHLHGEAVRIPWDVLSVSPSHVEAEAPMVRTPFVLRRRLEVNGRSLTSSSIATNTGRERAPYCWGHHPCFDRATFEGGRIEIAAKDAHAPGPAYDPANSRVAVDTPFTWPSAPGLDGVSIDVSLIPKSADGRQEHISVTPENGLARLFAPKYARMLEVEVDLRQLPYMLVWQNYQAPRSSFWGAADIFTLEPATFAGRSIADAVAADAVRWLDPGETARVDMTMTWTDAT